MTPTPRAAWLLAAAALTAVVLPPALAVTLFLAVLAAALADAWAVRAPPSLTRQVAPVLSRGVPAPLRVQVAPAGPVVRVRQPVPPDLRLVPTEGDGVLEGTVTAQRRGRHGLPAPASRSTGPLGLGAAFHRGKEEGEVLVYPDMPAAWRLAMAVRYGTFREEGRRSRGPLGLGTEFESIRDYQPDDDIRQVNWRATARMGRPMSNQWRIEQDRDVVCVVDMGRLMGAPLRDRTRLDAAVDAVAAIGMVADEVGDRCGVIAFDDRIRRQLPPRRDGGSAVVRAVFDLEPSPIEADYELAFRAVGSAKRAFVLVLTDLLEESAARPLVEAMGILARRHAVVVAGVTDDDLVQAVAVPPADRAGAYRAVVALDVLEARFRVATLLRHAGAEVVEAPLEQLSGACVAAYLRAKSRARL